MKVSIVTICLLVGLSSASIRLPLPLSIQQKFPWLVDEAITDDQVKVVGGSDASSGEAPYQIALMRSGSFICGGSLISSKTVVTAAHCVYGYESSPSSFTIRYGTLDRNNGPTISVSKVNRHNSYSSSTIDYDIATLTLSSAFQPGDNAAVVGLASSEPDTGSTVQLTGWGRLSAGGSLPTKLQKASLTKLSKSDCQSRWGFVNSITDRMVCAHNAKQSACNGDSGGPLTLNGVLVGVVSWGSSSCLHATYPNVYANVANLRSWLQSNMS